MHSKHAAKQARGLIMYLILLIFHAVFTQCPGCSQGVHEVGTAQLQGQRYVTGHWPGSTLAGRR